MYPYLLVNKTHKSLCDFKVRTDLPIQDRGLDLDIISKKKTCQISYLVLGEMEIKGIFILKIRKKTAEMCRTHKEKGCFGRFDILRTCCREKGPEASSQLSSVKGCQNRQLEGW